MKAVICEVCGDIQFIKQDGLYVCQNCGMKYTVEEMSELVGEVPDDRVAAAQADTETAPLSSNEQTEAQELEQLYVSARVARDLNDYQKAAQEYEQIFKKDPSSWEAAFYSGFLRAKLSTVYTVRTTSNAMRNSVSTSLNLISTHVESRQDKIAAVQEVAARAAEISDELFEMARSHYDTLDEAGKEKHKLALANDCSAAKDILYGLGDDVDALFSGYPELADVVADAWKSGVEKHNSILDLYDYKEANRNIILEYVPKIQKYDRSYDPPSMKKKKRGCFVATAVYGSYDCPEVWTLRRFRDDTLAETWYGRAFIWLYYAVSPTLVKWFGKTAWFQRLCRVPLDRLVRRLNAEGVQDSPYQDRSY